MYCIYSLSFTQVESGVRRLNITPEKIVSHQPAQQNEELWTDCNDPLVTNRLLVIVYLFATHFICL